MRGETKHHRPAGKKESVNLRSVKQNELLTLPGRVTATSVELPAKLAYEDFVTIGLKLGQLKHFTKFAIGDWLVYGEHNYGERYAQAAAEIGLSSDEAHMLHYVSSRVAVSARNISLFWSHHKEVAKLEPKKQVQWLDRAAKERWTVKILCEQLESKGLRQPRRKLLSDPARHVPTEFHEETPEDKKIRERVNVEQVTCPVCEENPATVKVCAGCLDSLHLAFAQIERNLKGKGVITNGS